jgi:hypothetical protein
VYRDRVIKEKMFFIHLYNSFVDITVNPHTQEIFANEECGNNIKIISIEPVRDMMIDLGNKYCYTGKYNSYHKIVEIFFINIMLIFKKVVDKLFRSVVRLPTLEKVSKSNQ